VDLLVVDTDLFVNRSVPPVLQIMTVASLQWQLQSKEEPQKASAATALNVVLSCMLPRGNSSFRFVLQPGKPSSSID